MTAAGFLASIELLKAGEKVLPSRLATEIRQGEIVVAATDEASGSTLQPAILSDLENEIVALVAQGDSNKMIATTCELTEESVKMYLRQIFAKVSDQKRAQAAAWCKRTRAGGGQGGSGRVAT